jgi:hypothetical protein
VRRSAEVVFGRRGDYCVGFGHSFHILIWAILVSGFEISRPPVSHTFSTRVLAIWCATNIRMGWAQSQCYIVN